LQFGIKGAKGLLLKKVTKPASGYTSGFCGFRLRLVAADWVLRCDAIDDFAYRYDCDFVMSEVSVLEERMPEKLKKIEEKREPKKRVKNPNYR